MTPGLTHEASLGFVMLPDRGCPPLAHLLALCLSLPCLSLPGCGCKTRLCLLTVQSISSVASL